MARRLVASVFSLFLVGLAGKAFADTPESSADPPNGVITLFGKTLCLPAAPADTACSWRVPALDPPAPASAADPVPMSIDLFGQRWCMPTGTPGDCVEETKSRPRTLELFGLRMCLGSVDDGCDVVIPSRG